jgi:hypothetical protein
LDGLRETDYLEDTGVDGILTLKCIFKKYDGNIKWIDLARIGTGGRL